MKKFLSKIPLLPLSALVFYLSVLFLWKIGIIPSEGNILVFLQNLYEHYGFIGLFISAFLEGIVYLGLYFPGSFIIALAVILSDGTTKSFFIISLIVAAALTLTAIINYTTGRYIVYKKKRENIKLDQIASKGLLLSMLHPNLLAFYFFNAGIKQQNPRKILFVPIVMVPYGFLFAWTIYLTKEPFQKAMENPWTVIILIMIWIIASFWIHYHHKRSTLNNSVP